MALPWAVGTSFLPLLEGGAFGGAAELLEVMPGSHDEGYQGWSAIRTPDRRFIRWDDGQRELYDLVADPWERTDLLAAEPEVAAAMEAQARRAPGGSGAGHARALIGLATKSALPPASRTPRRQAPPGRVGSSRPSYAVRLASSDAGMRMTLPETRS